MLNNPFNGLNGRERELLIMALILKKKLSFHNVVLEHDGTYYVGLRGRINIQENPNKNVNDLAAFIDSHPDLTLSEVMEVIKRKTRE
ncbi:hypothetical protein [Halalkalibacter flavus]|uniref:hypothetical protein n=1 Tax=Halalkalibacter flavus TaxID=3090668 RepID=UPI002FC6C944